MNVPAAKARYLKERLRDDLSVSCIRYHVRRHCPDGIVQTMVTLQPLGLENGKAVRLRGNLYRGGLQNPLPANRLVRLGYDPQNFVAGADQALQARHGEGRRTHEEDSHCGVCGSRVGAGGLASLDGLRTGSYYNIARCAQALQAWRCKQGRLV